MSSTETTGATGYGSATAQFLAGLVELAYWQYDQGVSNPGYNGDVTVPAGWEQIAAFKAPELDFNAAAAQFLSANPGLVQGMAAQPAAAANEALNDQVSAFLTDPTRLQALAVGTQDVFWGFALKATTADTNVIVLRGTRTVQEWTEDATGFQVPLPLVWFSDGRLKLAKAHLGFLIAYAFLQPQITAAAAQFDGTQTTQVAGHSLGSALTTLASLNLKVKSLTTPVQHYNFASPRVGDPSFVGAYDFFLPDTYRVVNYADLVPVLPPEQLDLTVLGHEFSFTYAHVADPALSYLWQTGDVGGNHSMEDNYAPAVQKNVATSQQPDFPVSVT